MKPNYKFNDEFEFPMIGFKLKQNDNGEIYVRTISNNSDSFSKIIREGDILFSIDELNTNNLKEYRNALKEENKKANLKVKNAQGIQSVHITLQKQKFK